MISNQSSNESFDVIVVGGGQAAQGPADVHEGPPRVLARARAQLLHPHRRGLRRDVHRRADSVNLKNMLHFLRRPDQSIIAFWKWGRAQRAVRSEEM